MVDLRSSLLLAALLGASLFVLSGCAEQALATRGGAEDGGLYYDPEDPFADDDDDWNPPDEDDDDGADDDDDDDQTISWVEVISYEPAAGATDQHPAPAAAYTCAIDGHARSTDANRDADANGDTDADQYADEYASAHADADGDADTDADGDAADRQDLCALL